MSLPSDATALGDSVFSLPIADYVGAGTLTIRSRSGPNAGDANRNAQIIVRVDDESQTLIGGAVGADYVLDNFRTDLAMTVTLTPTEAYDDQNPIHPRTIRGVYAT